MNPNSMTGEPNQSSQNHPSVFNFDPYPPTFPINWNQANPFARSAPVSPELGGFTSPQPSLSDPATPYLYPNSSSVPQNIPYANPMGNDLNLLADPMRAVSAIPEEVLGNEFQVSPPTPFGSPVAQTTWAAPNNFSFGSLEVPGSSQDVVQFPFEILAGQGDQRTFRRKRKPDFLPSHYTKRHITEEKMAEHMSRLHISSETAPSTETESIRQQRLYMCEEMRKLQADSIIPPSLLSKMNEPCKALVLWKPPTRLIPPVEDPNSVDENDNNNAASVPDRENVESEMENDMEMDNC